jgi:hypothetical protein
MDDHHSFLLQSRIGDFILLFNEGPPNEAIELPYWKSGEIIFLPFEKGSGPLLFVHLEIDKEYRVPPFLRMEWGGQSCPFC